ncbi:hypothetical protein J7I84_13955 [Arthrobacter sp. ISL-85]|uniref:hypothetical protein n=1 Tax=Arthrobacter sp. ISL-85 TaxID=2819115 RepID=UPI001BEBD78E|nr:hypothetical protein [Arthrobacter sp. ISL-85]MBT2567590.1 hypothetical protein [Arthrobacter sp. ISL-85]
MILCIKGNHLLSSNFRQEKIAWRISAAFRLQKPVNHGKEIPERELKGIVRKAQLNGSPVKSSEYMTVRRQSEGCISGWSAESAEACPFGRKRNLSSGPAGKAGAG